MGGFPSFDGKWLAAIGAGGVHRVSLDRKPVLVEKVYETSGCNTFDHPIYDAAGRLLVVERRWRGDVYSVPIPDTGRRPSSGSDDGRRRRPPAAI